MSFLLSFVWCFRVDSNLNAEIAALIHSIFLKMKATRTRPKDEEILQSISFLKVIALFHQNLCSFHCSGVYWFLQLSYELRETKFSRNTYHSPPCWRLPQEIIFMEFSVVDFFGSRLQVEMISCENGYSEQISWTIDAAQVNASDSHFLFFVVNKRKSPKEERRPHTHNMLLICAHIHYVWIILIH